MADDTTEPAISSGISFSDDELSELEAEFQAPPDEEAEDDAEDEDEEGETEGDEDEEEGEVEGEETEEDNEEDEGERVEGEPEEGKGKDPALDEKTEEEKTEGFELLVDGQQILVKDEEELAAWAQKGIHYEKVDSQRQKLVDDATFTMNAMINDPMASLEEIWTSKYGGNHEQARQHVARMAEQYLEPIWRELTAEPAERLKIQQDRFTKRQQQTQVQQQQAAEGQFSKEDIQFIQTMDVQIASALEAVDLPKEDTTLRKWMADVMREGLDRGIQPDPRGAAEFIKSQQDERQKALGNSAPDKDRKKTGGKKNAARIAKAKARRSSRQGGKAPPGKKRAEPQYMTSREWLSDLNDDLNLE